MLVSRVRVVPADAVPGPDLACPPRVEVQGADTAPTVLACDVDVMNAQSFLKTHRWRWAVHNSNSPRVYFCSSPDSCLQASAYVELMTPVQVCLTLPCACLQFLLACWMTVCCCFSSWNPRLRSGIWYEGALPAAHQGPALHVRKPALRAAAGAARLEHTTK